MICIECGEPVPSVYRLLSASKARLTRCEQCGSYADKYVEYEFVNLLLDLLLLSPQPYRHLIFNQLASSPRGIPVCAHLFSSFSFSILLSLISFLCLFPRINIGSYFYSSPYLMLVCVSLFLSFSLFLFLSFSLSLSLSLSLNSLLAFMFDSFVFLFVFLLFLLDQLSAGSAGWDPVGAVQLGKGLIKAVLSAAAFYAGCGCGILLSERRLPKATASVEKPPVDCWRLAVALIASSFGRCFVMPMAIWDYPRAFSVALDAFVWTSNAVVIGAMCRSGSLMANMSVLFGILSRGVLLLILESWF